MLQVNLPNILTIGLIFMAALWALSLGKDKGGTVGYVGLASADVIEDVADYATTARTYFDQPYKESKVKK